MLSKFSNSEAEILDSWLISKISKMNINTHLPISSKTSLIKLYIRTSIEKLKFKAYCPKIHSLI